MKKLLILLVVVLFSGCGNGRDEFLEAFNESTLNMANTVHPILEGLSRKACGYEEIQYGDGWAKGGQLIFKRESEERCVSGTKNAYYIRCYEWTWSGPKLFKRPTKDVSLGSFSCIDESQVDIPYHDKKMQKAEIGKVYAE